VLVSGTAGAGKTSVAAVAAAAACRRGERALCFSFEESPDQLVRNLRSVSIDLERPLKRGLLRIHASRPTAHGLERHLLEMHQAIADHDPHLVVIDPVTSLGVVGSSRETQSMLTRIMDFLKLRGTTAVLTSLTSGGEAVEHTAVAISSLVDTWLILEVIRGGGERNRTLSVVKSRGMAHSNQSAEFRFGSDGLHLLDAYLGPGGVLTGSARLAQEAADAAATRAAEEGIARARADRARRRRTFDRRLAELRDRFDEDDARLARSIAEEAALRQKVAADRRDMAASRGVFQRRSGPPARDGRNGR
jgi:circadian clock protein KaiC